MEQDNRTIVQPLTGQVKVQNGCRVVHFEQNA